MHPFMPFMSGNQSVLIQMTGKGSFYSVQLVTEHDTDFMLNKFYSYKDASLVANTFRLTWESTS